jgi:hypothetical protein
MRAYTTGMRHARDILSRTSHLSRHARDAMARRATTWGTCWVCHHSRRLSETVYLTGIDALTCHWCLSSNPPISAHHERRVLALEQYEDGQWEKVKP